LTHRRHSATKVICPTCKAPIPSHDVNVSEGVGLFLLVFGAIWNGIVYTFVLGAVTEGPGFMKWFMILFMVPFVLAGIAVILGAVYVLFVKASFAMNREAFLLRREILFVRLQKRHGISEITGVGIAEAYRQNGVPVMGVGIHVKSQDHAITFGSGLPADEKKWLAWEIYDFWTSVAAGP